MTTSCVPRGVPACTGAFTNKVAFPAFKISCPSVPNPLTVARIWLGASGGGVCVVAVEAAGKSVSTRNVISVPGCKSAESWGEGGARGVAAGGATEGTDTAVIVAATEVGAG